MYKMVEIDLLKTLEKGKVQLDMKANRKIFKQTKKQREQIALDFINLHKNNIIEEWLLSASSLESIYYNLVGGVYGDTEDNSVEISSTESHTGNPIIFDL